jgi:hypothetical protein
VRSNAAKTTKRASGWCGPRTYNPVAQGRARTAFLGAPPQAQPAAQDIDNGAITHMLQRLQHPLLHHCEASAIMRQLSAWLNAYWSRARDPAGASPGHASTNSLSLLCRAIHCLQPRAAVSFLGIDAAALGPSKTVRCASCVSGTTPHTIGCRLACWLMPELWRMQPRRLRGASALPLFQLRVQL